MNNNIDMNKKIISDSAGEAFASLAYDVALAVAAFQARRKDSLNGNRDKENEKKLFELRKYENVITYEGGDAG